ncbi:hypothetical protein KY330_00820 [Candidatus Woesearchaeota archaeon]|nr:hypothetical protein [Candidatus Woesearchaeota archaeon]
MVLELLTWFWNTFGIYGIIAIILLLLYIFRKQIVALFYDFLDFALSHLDNFIGVGTLGFDIGDWIAAIIIYSRQRKIVGKFWATINALAVANFFLSFIPVVGEAIEFVTNLIPFTALIEALFSKRPHAIDALSKAKKDITVAQNLMIDTRKNEKELKESERLIKKNPVKSLEKSREIIISLEQKIITIINKEIQDAQSIIDSITSQHLEAPANILEPLEQAIEEASSLIQQAEQLIATDTNQAINLIRQAKQLTITAANEFNTKISQQISPSL